MADCPSIGTNVNATSLAVALGCSADADTVWYYQQPNDISSFSNTITKVARSPISLDRQRRKGGVTDLEAAPAFPQDTTIDTVAFWAPVMHFTRWKGPAAGAFGYGVTGVLASGYEVDHKGNLPENTLVIASGFTESQNNGLKVVGAGSTINEIKTTGLVVETPEKTATLHECGYRADEGDIVLDSIGNLTSTTLDFTTLPLNVGAHIYVKGLATSGLARIRAIAANQLTLDNWNQTITDDPGTSKTADIYYGMWCRNVPVTDPDFTVNSLMIEVGYDFPGGRKYEYAEGCVLNTTALAMPLTEKSTFDFATVSKIVNPPVDSRRAGTFKNFTANEQFNTSEDIARLKISGVDTTGDTTYFTECTVNVNNNVTAKKVLGHLGAIDMLYGNFEVNSSMTALFDDPEVPAAIVNNTTAGFTVALDNNDGMVVIDQPEITLGNGEKSFPTGDKVEIALENDAFGSSMGYTQSVTLFRYNPM